MHVHTLWHGHCDDIPMKQNF